MARSNQTTRGNQRTYQWRGRQFYSVTTIKDVALRKFALEKWNRNAVAEGVVRNRDLLNVYFSKCETPDQCQRVTDLLDLCIHCSATYKFLQDVPFLRTKRAQDIGSAVHVSIDAHQLGKPIPPPPLAIAKRMEQWERFVTEWQPTFELSEAQVYNATESYAGTLDVIFTVPVEVITREVLVAIGWDVPEDRDYVRILGDYKSSARGIYPEVALQLAPYRAAEFIGMPDGSEVPMPAVDGCVAIRVTDDDCELIPVETHRGIFDMFLFARELFRFSEVVSKQVLHPPLTPAKVTAAA